MTRPASPEGYGEAGRSAFASAEGFGETRRCENAQRPPAVVFDEVSKFYGEVLGVNRVTLNIPPGITSLVGPNGSGKTTLMKSLIRRYTKQTLNHIRGPVTVVSGKKKRITFVECNNDLNSMIDVAKVADLVLLMIDGSYGFEMVRPGLTSSALCQVHPVNQL